MTLSLFQALTEDLDITFYKIFHPNLCLSFVLSPIYIFYLYELFIWFGYKSFVGYVANVMCILNIFSDSVACLLFSLNVGFCWTGVFIFNEAQLINLFIYNYVFVT